MTRADERRIERVIRECRELNVEPTPQTIAEIMVDQDTSWGEVEDSGQPEATTTYAEYEEAASRLLR